MKWESLSSRWCNNNRFFPFVVSKKRETSSLWFLHNRLSFTKRLLPRSFVERYQFIAGSREQTISVDVTLSILYLIREGAEPVLIPVLGSHYLKKIYSTKLGVPISIWSNLLPVFQKMWSKGVPVPSDYLVAFIQFWEYSLNRHCAWYEEGTNQVPRIRMVGSHGCFRIWSLL